MEVFNRREVQELLILFLLGHWGLPYLTIWEVLSMLFSVTLLHGNQILDLVLKRAENGSSVGVSWCETGERVRS